jgi:hypothetical protein
VTFDPTYVVGTSTVIPAVSVTVDPQFGHDRGDLHDLGVITLASPVSATPVVLPTAGLLDQLAAQGGLHGQDFTNVGYGATGWAFGGGPPTYVDFFPGCPEDLGLTVHGARTERAEAASEHSRHR